MEKRLEDKTKVVDYLGRVQAKILKENKYSLIFIFNGKTCKLSFRKGKRSLGRSKMIDYDCTLLALVINNEYWGTFEGLYNIELSLIRLLKTIY